MNPKQQRELVSGATESPSNPLSRAPWLGALESSAWDHTEACHQQRQPFLEEKTGESGFLPGEERRQTQDVEVREWPGKCLEED